MHYSKMLSEEKIYMYEFNGVSTGIYVSMKSALTLAVYDVITIQQVSMKSGDYDTFVPYLSEIVKYILRYQPKAQVLLHEGWSYKDGTDILVKEAGYASSEEMFFDIESSYERALSENDDICGIIRSARAVEKAKEMGMTEIYSDSLHLNKNGKYLLALTWIKTLSKRKISARSCLDFDAGADGYEISIMEDASDFASGR